MMDTLNGWDMIYMDEDTWLYVKDKAAEQNYILSANEVQTDDLLEPNMWLFRSGMPQAELWKLIRERNQNARKKEG